jgi:hypothetical protein
MDKKELVLEIEELEERIALSTDDELEDVSAASNGGVDSLDGVDTNQADTQGSVPA